MKYMRARMHAHAPTLTRNQRSLPSSETYEPYFAAENLPLPRVTLRAALVGAQALVSHHTSHCNTICMDLTRSDEPTLT